MNSLVIIALSLLVAMATAVPCSNVCMAGCNLAKADCDGAVVLGPVCDIAFGQCSAGCSAICACDDGCNGQCGPDFETCKTQAGNNVVLRIQCSAVFDACAVQCQAGCAVQTAFDTVGQVLGGGAAPQ